MDAPPQILDFAFSEKYADTEEYLERLLSDSEALDHARDEWDCAFKLLLNANQIDFDTANNEILPIFGPLSSLLARCYISKGLSQRAEEILKFDYRIASLWYLDECEQVEKDAWLSSYLTRLELHVPRNPIEARDQWLYGKFLAGTTLKKIAAELKGKPETWDKIERPSGIRAAVNRYAKRNGKPLPPTRSPGRPRKTK